MFYFCFVSKRIECREIVSKQYAEFSLISVFIVFVQRNFGLIETVIHRSSFYKLISLYQHHFINIFYQTTGYCYKCEIQWKSCGKYSIKLNEEMLTFTYRYYVDASASQLMSCHVCRNVGRWQNSNSQITSKSRYFIRIVHNG